MISLLQIQIGIAGLLLGCAAVSLCVAARFAATTWRSAGASRSDLLALAAVVGLGAAFRIMLPVRLATIFIGYRNTAHAIDIAEVHHYGFGTPVLYNTVFQLFPADHLTLMHTNVVLGILLIPFMATWALQLSRDRRVGVLVGLLIALLPLFVRNDTSDANNVPCLLWLFSGLVLWHAALSSGRSALLLPTLALLALAAIGRPELPLLIPPFLALMAIAGLSGRPRLRLRAVAAAMVGWLLLVLPHALHILGRAAWLNQGDSLPGIDPAEILNPGRLLYERTLLLRWDLLPCAIPVLVVVALFLPPPGGRKTDGALILAALLAILPTLADLDRANIARVQVPVALLLLPSAAAAVFRIGDRLRRPWVAPALIGLTLASAIPTGLTLFAPTNSDHEEALLATARESLPEAPHVLVLRWDGDRDPGDPDARFTHLHVPDYWFRRPAGSSILQSIEGWEETRTREIPAYFLRSMRCYAEFRPSETEPARGENLREPCRRMLDLQLRTVFEREVPNRGNIWINYYGDTPTLTLGLYEILGPKEIP